MAGRKRRKSRKMGWKGQLLGIVGLLTAIVFMPTTIVLMMGMIPTVVAAVIDRSGKGTKALTVGAMNLAGCTPFLIKLWSTGHTSEMAVSLITDPRTMSIMFAAAGIGYLVDWAMSGIVGTLMLQRSTGRIVDIKKKQEALIERWGQEVAGEMPLDAYGFPLEVPEEQKQKKKDKKTKG
ncbi:MAG: hypothetical protein H6867_05475 [Rhodospirillales bacterium]|nr:hypothetical protein [Rhodospirillales bacterium]MCB9994980.1 hypothetical protein [Rhodospirillales bacterium]